MQLKKYPKTYKLLVDYMQIGFGETTVNCPYWINKLAKGMRGPYSGKGTPSQIKHAASLRASKLGIDLTRLSQSGLLTFLKQNRIGIDCSGLVYNLVDCFDKEKGGQGVAPRLFGSLDFPDWNPAWRANADKLTSHQVTRKVELTNVHVGDLIRLQNGKHVLFVVDKTSGSLSYVHSSRLLTKVTGVHLGKITIIDWGKGLEVQNWLEATPNGASFGQKYFNPVVGDSLRRFTWW